MVILLDEYRKSCKRKKIGSSRAVLPAALENKEGKHMRFKELREEKDITQAELIQQFNRKYGKKYTVPAISLIENGQRMPETQALINLADFYGVSVDYLLGISEWRVSGEPGLTAKEWALVRAYRQDDERGRDTIRQIAEYESSLPDCKDILFGK